MTIKDLVSTHQWVIDKHENIKITVIVYRNKDEYLPELPANEAIEKYGMKTVKAWKNNVSIKRTITQSKG